MNWETVELGDVCTFVYGKALAAKQRRPGPVEVYGSGGLIGSHDAAVAEGPAIIIGRKGSFGSVHYSDSDVWPIDTTFYVDKAHTDCELRWLYWMLPCLGLDKLNRAAAVPGLHRDDAYRKKIPLPPLDEQRRIAGILDAADALRCRRREALALLDTLPGAIFAKMFGALTTTDRFPRGPLSDLIRGFDTGKNLAPASDEEGARHRVLKVSAVTKGEFIEAESKPLPADYSPPASHFVKPGDLLFSRANTSALIGATAMVENVSDNIVLPDKIWRFILDPEKAEPTFLHYLFATRKFRDEISRRATGSSGSMKNISKAKVLSIEVGQPPIEMQREFTRKVRISRDLRAQVSGHLAELEVLFTSLQSRAFAGEL